MEIYKMSYLTAKEKMALYCYANGWDHEGKPYFNCSKCTDKMKDTFGCGYEEKYAGKSKLAQQEEHDLLGVCPAYWRQQPFIIDVLQMRAFRENLGHPLHIPNRLLQSITWLSIYEEQARETLRKARENK